MHSGLSQLIILSREVSVFPWRLWKDCQLGIVCIAFGMVEKDFVTT
jgi:hypothetical protein